jgi:hypothetical protein
MHALLDLLSISFEGLAAVPVRTSTGWALGARGEWWRGGC